MFVYVDLGLVVSSVSDAWAGNNCAGSGVILSGSFRSWLQHPVAV